jgi:hypothetical protein
MAKLRVGHAANSKLNGEWAKHVRKKSGCKKVTSGLRRAESKRIIYQEVFLIREWPCVST